MHRRRLELIFIFFRGGSSIKVSYLKILNTQLILLIYINMHTLLIYLRDTTKYNTSLTDLSYKLKNYKMTA